jgi:hypothetical protein
VARIFPVISIEQMMTIGKPRLEVGATNSNWDFLCMLFAISASDLKEAFRTTPDFPRLLFLYCYPHLQPIRSQLNPAPKTASFTKQPPKYGGKQVCKNRNIKSADIKPKRMWLFSYHIRCENEI